MNKQKTHYELHTSNFIDSEKKVIEIICQMMQVSKDDIFKQVKTQDIKDSRFLLTLWYHRVFKITLEGIGKKVSYSPKHYTTIIKNLRKIENYIQTEERIRKVWDRIRFVNRDYEFPKKDTALLELELERKRLEEYYIKTPPQKSSLRFATN